MTVGTFCAWRVWEYFVSAGTVGVFCACSECGDVLCLQNV